MHDLLVRWGWPDTPARAFATATLVTLVAGMAVWITGVGNSRFDDGYIQLAENLVRGYGYCFTPGDSPVLHRPPVYPLLLVPVASAPEVFRRPLLVILQSVLVGATAAGMAAIGRRWFDARVAAWSVLILLTDIWLLATVKTTVATFLEIALYVALAWAIAPWFARSSVDEEQRPWRTAVVIGLLGGILSLTHGSKILSVALILGLAGLVSLGRRDVGRVVAVALAGFVMAAVITPWTLRNWYVSGEFIPISTNAGHLYFAGNAHWGLTAPMQRKEEPWQQAALRHAGVKTPMGDVERFWGLRDPDLAREVDRRMSVHLREHPGAFAAKLLLNACEFYFPTAHPLYVKLHGDQPLSWRQVFATSKSLDWTLISLYHLLLLCLVAWGFRLPPSTKDETRVAWLLAAMVAAFALPYLPFLVRAGFARYASATVPLLAILAARISRRGGEAKA